MPEPTPPDRFAPTVPRVLGAIVGEIVAIIVLGGLVESVSGDIVAAPFRRFLVLFFSLTIATWIARHLVTRKAPP
jgi:hypothetical protein